MRIIACCLAFATTILWLCAQSEILPLAPPDAKAGQRFQAIKLPASVKVEHREMRLEFLSYGWQVEDTYELHNTGAQPYEAHFAVAFRKTPHFLQPPVWIDDEPSGAWRLYFHSEVLRRLKQHPPNREPSDILEEQGAFFLSNDPVQNWLNNNGLWDEGYPVPYYPGISMQYGVDRTPRGRETPSSVQILTCSVSIPAGSRRRLQLRYWMPCDTQQSEIEMWIGIEYFGFAYALRMRKDMQSFPIELRVPKTYQIGCTTTIEEVASDAYYTVYRAEANAQPFGVVAAHPRLFRTRLIDLGASGELSGRFDPVIYQAQLVENEPYMSSLKWFRWLGARLDAAEQDSEREERFMLRDESVPVVKFVFAGEQLTLTAGELRLTLTLNSKQAQWNGEPFSLSAPVRRIDDEWLIPLRDAVFFYWRLVGDAILKEREYYGAELKVSPPRALDDIVIETEENLPRLRVRIRGEPREEQDGVQDF
ncbi:MAG: copper amine oxidase N-terminal domain-containing protein [Fimbriimonadales bacterium]|nr:copper amine oxidase N-terminal domain-containing protein [Fimbriimonadales bacterium]